VAHLAILEHGVHPLHCRQLLLAQLVESHQVREQLVPEDVTAMQEQQQALCYQDRAWTLTSPKDWWTQQCEHFGVQDVIMLWPAETQHHQTC
jgi:hypothetical protein